jgi:multidrug efflux pump subunit AcrB
MDHAGFTLNNMTLLGMTIAVGIVIDDAIVMLENIYRHMEEHKISPVKAALEGAEEIGFAVIAMSLVAHRHLRAAGLHGRHRRPLR